MHIFCSLGRKGYCIHFFGIFVYVYSPHSYVIIDTLLLFFVVVAGARGSALTDGNQGTLAGKNGDGCEECGEEDDLAQAKLKPIGEEETLESEERTREGQNGRREEVWGFEIALGPLK
jgi:hypothetical protein